MRYIDLFGGIGGFRYGIERATNGRWQCVYYADIDKYATAVYSHNFKEDWKPTDIRKVEPESIPGADLICGGFPCQSFSVAGKRKGFEDTRGTLYHEILRIARAKRIKYLFLENVKGLLNHDEGATFATILQSLDESGYDAQWQVLNSKWWVPQNRERVFIVANLRGEPRPEIFPIGENDPASAQTARGELQTSKISGAITESEYKQHGDGTYVIHTEEAREYKDFSPTVSSGGGHLPHVVQPVLTPDKTKKRQNGRRFKDAGEEMFTLTGQDKHGIMMEIANTVTPDTYLAKGARKRIDGKAVLTSMHERRIRRLTPIECERLQGFPDNWTAEPKISDTQRYKMCGNAVTTNVIQAIVEKWINNSKVD